MPAQPLVIDATWADVRVLASPLELQNRKTVSDAFNYNVALKEKKELDAGKHLSDVAHEAARDLTH